MRGLRWWIAGLVILATLINFINRLTVAVLAPVITVSAEWFPDRQRALAMAIFNSGSALGSVAAPPLIVGLELWLGWQATFVAVGALGFVWLALWLVFYEEPEHQPKGAPDVRGFSLKQIGLFAWLPYLATDAGSLTGGWMSGHRMGRGWNVNAAR